MWTLAERIVASIAWGAWFHSKHCIVSRGSLSGVGGRERHRWALTCRTVASMEAWVEWLHCRHGAVGMSSLGGGVAESSSGKHSVEGHLPAKLWQQWQVQHGQEIACRIMASMEVCNLQL